MSGLLGQSLGVAIVDDEPLARYKIRSMLSPLTDMDVLGEARDVNGAITLIDETKPDLVFLDILMPDGSGIEVLQSVRHAPGVIFTTALDTHAIAAFDVGAIDYLVKPFSQVRFHKALQRAQDVIQIGTRVGNDTHPDSRSLEGSTIKTLFVRTQRGTANLKISEIEYLQGQGDYVQIYSDKTRHLTLIRLKEFEEQLDSNIFLRIHRSFIVNINCVSMITSIGNGRCSVTMRSGEEFCASRKGTVLLRRHWARLKCGSKSRKSIVDQNQH